MTDQDSHYHLQNKQDKDNNGGTMNMSDGVSGAMYLLVDSQRSQCTCSV